MAETLTGTCLCEGVEYEVKDPPGTRVLPLHTLPAVDRLEPRGCSRRQGELQGHQGRGPGHDLQERVGTAQLLQRLRVHLYDDLGDVYFVAAGLMRDLDLEPSFHQQVAYKARWHQIGDDAPQFDEMPPA